MSEVMRILRRYGYALYLGAGLQAAGITIADWRFYLIGISVIALVHWKYECEDGE